MSALPDLVIVVGAVPTLAVLIAQLRRASGALTSYRLHFAAGLEADDVAGFLAGLSGFLRPRWRRLFDSPVIVLEVRADRLGIEHHLLVEPEWQRAVESLLQASVPSVRYERADIPKSDVDTATEYRLTSSGRPLRVDAAAVATKTLATLAPLDDGERVVVQWLLTPVGPVSPPRVAKAAENELALLRRPEIVANGEAATALRQKQAHPLLFGTGRIGVSAASLCRARRLLRDVEGSWHETRAPGVHLRRRLIPERLAAVRLNRRRSGLLPASVFNTHELMGLIAWPVGVTQLPGLEIGGCRPLPPSPLVPSVGTIIGRSNFPGIRRHVAMSPEAKVRHLHVLGPSGTGKSTLCQRMVQQDLAAGLGVCLVDFKADLVRSVLATAEAHERRDDIVMLDVTDKAPLGLNPLQSPDAQQAEVAIENLTGLFRALWTSAWGPRTDDLVRGALRTLCFSGNYTLAEVPTLLLQPVFRRRLVGRIDDPSLQEFWGWYEALSDSERISITAPALNKMRTWLMRPQIRALCGQSQPAISIREIFASNKVLIVPLAAGSIGTEAASLLGAIVLSEIFNATRARAAVPPADRSPFVVYLDEFQHVAHLAVPMADVLAESRGLGVGFVMANQHLGQLGRTLQTDVLANPRSRATFQLGAGDARVMARELGGGLTPNDLMGLGAFEVVAQIHAAGRTQPPLTAQTLPAPEPAHDPELIRQLSRARYGVDRQTVEDEIQARQAGRTPEAPIGRRRSAS